MRALVLDERMAADLVTGVHAIIVSPDQLLPPAPGTFDSRLVIHDGMRIVGSACASESVRIADGDAFHADADGIRTRSAAMVFVTRPKMGPATAPEARGRTELWRCRHGEWHEITDERARLATAAEHQPFPIGSWVVFVADPEPISIRCVACWGAGYEMEAEHDPRCGGDCMAYHCPIPVQVLCAVCEGEGGSEPIYCTPTTDETMFEWEAPRP